MGFLGILIVNTFLTILLVIAGLFLLSLILFIVFSILSAKDKESKWKKVAKIVSGILTMILFVPILGSILLINSSRYQIVKYNDKTYRFKNELIEDFHKSVDSCDITQLNKYLEKDPALVYTNPKFSNYYALGQSINNKDLNCVKYFVEERKVDVNRVSNTDTIGPIDALVDEYDPTIMNYLLDQNIDVNKEVDYYTMTDLINSFTSDDYIDLDDINIMTKLIDKGFDLNVKYNNKTIKDIVNDSQYDDIINIESLRSVINSH